MPLNSTASLGTWTIATCAVKASLFASGNQYTTVIGVPIFACFQTDIPTCMLLLVDPKISAFRVNLSTLYMLLVALSKHLSDAQFLCCSHSITGLTDHCTTFVLLAAYGAGAAELEKIPVMRGMQWSASQALEQPIALHYTVRSMEQLASLPPDFLVLHNAGNLCSFMSVPISTDSEVIGILTIAKEDCEGFDIDRWESHLG